MTGDFHTTRAASRAAISVVQDHMNELLREGKKPFLVYFTDQAPGATKKPGCRICGTVGDDGREYVIHLAQYDIQDTSYLCFGVVCERCDEEKLKELLRKRIVEIALETMKENLS